MRGSRAQSEALMRITGYATQYATARAWATGFTFITTGLLLFAFPRPEAEEKAWKALERVRLTERRHPQGGVLLQGHAPAVRLAQAIEHDLICSYSTNRSRPRPLVGQRPSTSSDARGSGQTCHPLEANVLQEVDLISDQSC